MLGKVNSWGPSDSKREYIAFWAWIAPHVVRAVEASFLEAHMMHPTRAEVENRVEKARKLVKTLKHDFKWSRQRIADRLPGLLRNELMGVKHSFEKEDERDIFSPDHTSHSATAPTPELAAPIQEQLDTEFGDPETDLAPSPVENPQVIETAEDGDSES